MIKEGERVSNFTLPGIDEKGIQRVFTLKELLDDKNFLVLYFYPKDNTPGCSQEACDFRDNINRVLQFASVAGVSPDSIESHKKFKEKYSLNFPLLSDHELKVIKEFGAYGDKNMYGKKVKGVIRSTFLIGRDGILKKAWRKVSVKGHVQEIIAYLNLKNV